MPATGFVTVDNVKIPLEGEESLLKVVRKAGIDLPTFCYHSQLSVYGACRMCVVEVDRMGVVASCSVPPQDGMNVKTNTERLRKIRRTILELLLANHDRECTTCGKSSQCKLQELSERFAVSTLRFGHGDKRFPIDASTPAIVRDPNKCILCGDCVRMCAEVQGVGILDFSFRGSKSTVGPAFGKNLNEVDCVQCGQCTTVCPTGALMVKSVTSEVWKALDDANKKVIVQIAPAVRVALGEEFGMAPGAIVTGKIVAALRRLGFDQVYDTSFTADLTIIEEGNEFIGRVRNGGVLPQFTSCCPGWVKYVEQYHPELIPNISSCKSPQQMFGSVAKRYLAKDLGWKPEDVVVVSIMPCTAKKFEAQRPEFVHDGVPDVDYVLSTRELARMIKEAGFSWDDLEVESFDLPLGLGSGAGMIFGNTGGVTEAVLRSAQQLLGLGTDSKIVYNEVRGLDGIKE
ncbi:MAG TPA: [FeFe] hydrogenase, group A, partial [Bacillota bacterium]|nr:[FeFe] hydrogenase, group A [Bacillota bacterium]